MAVGARRVEAEARGMAILALVLSIGAAVIALPPISVPGLGLVMLAPLVAVLDGARARRAFAITWLWGVAMALIVTRWLLHALVVQYGASPVPSALFAVLLIGALALVPATMAAAFARLSPRLADGAAPLAFAALWTFGEWLRAEPLGVPWLLAAHPFAGRPIALQLAELGGAHAVGFVATAVAAGIGLALRRGSPWPLAAPAALAAAALAFGAWRLAAPPAPGGAPLRVGVVQASVPQAERFQPGSAARNVLRHIDASRRLARGGRLDLLVWSETAVDVDIDEAPQVRTALERLADELGVPLVTGAPRTAGGRHTNSVVVFAPGGGLAESYDKQRLVPFSEYDPDALALVGRLLGPVTEGDPYVPGTRATVLRAGPVPFAAPVCFEVTYPELVRRFRANGAQLLVNLSNDAWFGPGGYPEMHLAHAVFRAIETRTWVVRGANTGISAAIDPLGRVRERLDAFSEGAFVAEVAASDVETFYARHGDVPVLAALALVLGGALARGPSRQRGRSRLVLPAARRR